MDNSYHGRDLEFYLKIILNYYWKVFFFITSGAFSSSSFASSAHFSNLFDKSLNFSMKSSGTLNCLHEKLPRINIKLPRSVITKTTSFTRFKVQQKAATGLWGFSRKKDFMRWFPVVFPIIGVFIVQMQDSNTQPQCYESVHLTNTPRHHQSVIVAG